MLQLKKLSLYVCIYRPIYGIGLNAFFKRYRHEFQVLQKNANVQMNDWQSFAIILFNVITNSQINYLRTAPNAYQPYDFTTQLTLDRFTIGATSSELSIHSSYGTHSGPDETMIFIFNAAYHDVPCSPMHVIKLSHVAPAYHRRIGPMSITFDESQRWNVIILNKQCNDQNLIQQFASRVGISQWWIFECSYAKDFSFCLYQN